MTYDATAQLLAVRVIGTVESNLNYSAVNYGDPITVGIAQWFGTRAAGILDRMRDTNSSEWYGVEPSIDSQLASIANSDTFWNTRYLTQVEGDSLVGVMSRNQGTQNQQLIDDLDVYKSHAITLGLAPDTDTAAMIFYFTMYHQGPAYADRILAAAGSHPTLDVLYQTCLTHVDEVTGTVVLGAYGARYKTAYDLILAADITPVVPAPLPPAPVPNGNGRMITKLGDMMLVKFANGEQVTYYPDGRDHWIPHTATPAPTPVQPPPPVDNGSWVLPLTGAPVMTSGFGPRAFDGLSSFHYGADFANPSGSPAGNVVSPCPLKITVAWESGTPNDPSSGTAGTYAKGHTLDGAYTFNFYHMVAGSLAVAVGDTLTTGQVIGVEGATGNVSGRHLHFEAYEGNFVSPWPPPYGNPVDPLPILRAHGVIV